MQNNKPTKGYENTDLELLKAIWALLQPFVIIAAVLYWIFF